MSASQFGPTFSGNIDKDFTNENGNTIEYWEDMQCRLQYMHAQVRLIPLLAPLS